MIEVTDAPRRAILVANPSADLYGSDRMMLEAVRGLVAEGDRIVVTCSVDGPLVGRLRDAGAIVRIEPVPIVRKSMLSVRGLFGLAKEILTSFPRMRRTIREINPDVVFANTLTIPFWTMAARSLRCPVVVYVHEAEASLSATSRALLTAPLRLATGVVYNSETSRSISPAPRLEGRKRTRVVHNGVEGPESPAPPRDAVTSPLRVVFVGRLSPRKGVDLVIEAAALLLDRGVEVVVDLVGDVFPGYEWYEASLHRLAHDRGLADRVRFRGFQSSVWPAFAAADIAVVPSRSDESFGNVVVEAVLSARPVVVADHSGLREAAAGLSSAVRVDVDDAVALADGIRRVHDEWESYRVAAIEDAAWARTKYEPSAFHVRLSLALSELTRASGKKRT